MDIQSVASGTGAYSGTVSQTSQTSQSKPLQPLENREPRPEERVERKEEAPRPVVNTQGQKTGTVINVTA